MEAKMDWLESQLSDIRSKAHSREDKVEQLMHHMNTLVDVQFAENKKVKARDIETMQMAETFAKLKEEVMQNSGERFIALKKTLNETIESLEKREKDLLESVEEMMHKRDDVSYSFEAELNNMKQSFTSLRMEFKKASKGQDFKNTSTSVFLLKAIDMKPDERKVVLNKLTEHEEKCRGAVMKVDHELKSHEEQFHQK
jgi:hypothetical protein